MIAPLPRRNTDRSRPDLGASPQAATDPVAGNPCLRHRECRSRHPFVHVDYCNKWGPGYCGLEEVSESSQAFGVVDATGILCPDLDDRSLAGVGACHDLVEPKSGCKKLASSLTLCTVRELVWDEPEPRIERSETSSAKPFTLAEP